MSHSVQTTAFSPSRGPGVFASRLELGTPAALSVIPPHFPSSFASASARSIFRNDSVIDADFDETGIQDVLRKVKQDFDAKGIASDLVQLEKEYNVHLAEAKKQLSEAA